VMGKRRRRTLVKRLPLYRCVCALFLIILHAALEAFDALGNVPHQLGNLAATEK